MARRVAARLSKACGVEVETVRGGSGEFSVYRDGQKVIDTNRLWYPAPKKVIEEVGEILAG